MVAAKKNKIDFTTGKIFPKLLTFALPIIATNILQMLYNAADMMVVSMSSEPNAVGAVGTTSSFINLVVNLFIGFSVGSNVTIARAIGARDNDRISKATHTAILLSIILGIFCAILGISTSKAVLIAMGNTGNILDLSVKYTVIYFAGIPFISLSNFLVSIFRAKGESKTPLVILSIAGVSNVLLNMFFVLVLGFSVEGVAIATVIANVISSVILLIKLIRCDDETKVNIRKLKIDRRALRDILIIGFPSGIEGALFSICNMTIQTSIVSIDKMVSPNPELHPVINGCAAQSNIDNFIYMAMSAIAQTATTFTSQNLGAGRIDRIKRGVFQNYFFVTAVGLFISGIILLFHNPLLSLYGITDGAVGTIEHIAYATAMDRIKIVTTTYFLCGVMSVGTAIMRGIGKSATPFAISLIGVGLLRMLWVYIVLPMDMTLFTLLISFPISWGLTAIVGFAFAMVYLKKLTRAFGLAKES